MLQEVCLLQRTHELRLNNFLIRTTQHLFSRCISKSHGDVPGQYATLRSNYWSVIFIGSVLPKEVVKNSLNEIEDYQLAQFNQHANLVLTNWIIPLERTSIASEPHLVLVFIGNVSVKVLGHFLCHQWQVRQSGNC